MSKKNSFPGCRFWVLLFQKGLQFAWAKTEANVWGTHCTLVASDLQKSQRGRLQKRFQPNTGCNGGHVCGIVGHTSSGECLGQQMLGYGVGMSSGKGIAGGSSLGILCLFPGLLRFTLRTGDFNLSLIF